MTAPKPKSELVRHPRKVDEEHRSCRTCGEVKKTEKFQPFKKYDRPNQPVYWSSDCRSCRAEVTRKKRYGFTLAELITKQGNALCPLCDKRMATCIDHDHETGATRGALCQTCNKAMHYVDNRDWLARAERYRDAGEI